MRKLLLCFLFLSITPLFSQAPKKLNSVEIHQAIKKLNFLGSALYIAAHPDDENTRLISYLSNHVHARTGYLSITRGDGGQNLIGTELKELLGIIRTQELLAARRIDGGEQLFTRAIDFGYTKTPEEALSIWDKQTVLGDVVWAIRTYKPDVIINRFNHRTSGDTHGQHTASALLSTEAFEMAKDSTAYPDQLKFTSTFQPKRLFFNTSPWFYDSDEAFQKASKTNFLKFDTGVYSPESGLSNSEIASLSRSQHQSQGFGSSGSRGSQLEYLELIEGDSIQNDNLFEGIDTSWNRIPGGKEIGELLYKVEKEFNFRDPSASIPELIQAYQLIQELKDDHWNKVKTAEIKEIILAASGLYLEALAKTPTANTSQEITVSLEAINRSNINIELSTISILPGNASISPNMVLQNNKEWEKEISYKIPEIALSGSPYWLKEKSSLGTYTVLEQELVGLPETPRNIDAIFELRVNGVYISFAKEIVFKKTDPVKGEVYQPFEIIPIVSSKIEEDVLIFPNGGSKNITVTITAGKENVSGEVKMDAGKNWKIEPLSAAFSIEEKGGTANLNFKVSPPKIQEEAFIEPVVIIDGKEYNNSITQINYDHIPIQTIISNSKTKLVKLEIQKKGENIGYIEGAGDVVPESLQQLGYNVTKLDPKNLSLSNLKTFDAVVIGIRAYNTVDELKFKQPLLMEYVKQGGNLIVQYNTNRGLKLEQIAPYNMKLSRDRVTEELAEVRFLNPQHPVLNTPNKISSKDFENWVQERGLYFASEWASEFTPILSMNDTNETPKNGSLLVAKHGKGYFIYTGLSFFRQFPNGVPGAYRLFTNLISIGK